MYNGGNVPLFASRVIAVGASYGTNCCGALVGLKTTDGFVVFGSGIPGNWLLVPYFFCKSESGPKSRALNGQAVTQAGSIPFSRRSTHIVHFDAVESGASESNVMQPYGHASHAAFKFGLVAWLGSIRTAPYLGSFIIAPFATVTHAGFWQ